VGQIQHNQDKRGLGIVGDGAACHWLYLVASVVLVLVCGIAVIYRRKTSRPKKHVFISDIKQ